MSRRIYELPVPRVALSVSKAALATGLSYERVLRPAIEAGEIPVFYVNGSSQLRRVLVADLEAFIRAQPRTIKRMSHHGD